MMMTRGVVAPRHRRSCDGCFLVAINYLIFAVVVMPPYTVVAQYTNQFAVRIAGGGSPDALAAKYNFVNLGQIGSLQGYYLFEHPKLQKRSVQPHVEHRENLKSDPQVEWVKQQVEKRRFKRDDKLSKSQPSLPPFSAKTSTFPDPLYPQQWYLNGGADEGMDMNVKPAWAKGYSGKGVVVTILDDGIQTNHPDLIYNYDPEASADINENDRDPTPRDNGDNKHGTRCAGEVAAAAFNTFCGVGVAFNASIGGVRMLDGTVSDAVEAQALSLNPDHIDIYSASWGPEDDGKTVDGPGPLATKAFLNGVIKGRGGKGSIFVWASGNGGTHTDSCNCDGYTNSVYTLSISSSTQAGFKPWYLEECSSTIATTYSSGTLGRDKSVVTVDMDPLLRPELLCTSAHTGTSASAPIAAGMCALALEANPNLTWRDVQHIVVLSANPRPLARESGWVLNGAKRKVSHKFGFGLMDGAAMVTLAEQWTPVPPQHLCKTAVMIVERPINRTYGSELTVGTNVSGCEGSDNEVHYLEHVQAKVWLSFLPRGNLRLVLTSPSGTPTMLLDVRPHDDVSATLDDWPFLSVHFWGEDPRGVWSLSVVNAGPKKPETDGLFSKWQLLLYGTDTKPVNLRPPSLQKYRNKQDKLLKSLSKPNDEKRVYDDNTLEDNPVVYDCHEQCDSQGCYGLDSSQCVACINMKLNKSCVAVCPEGYYRAGSNCMKCHPDCDSCTGPGYHSCLSCAPQLYYITDLALCIRSCPHTYFQDELTKTCLSCQESCASCQDGHTLCSSCESHLVLYNNSCLASCPIGTFLSHHQRCQPCHPSCKACSGGHLSDCLPVGLRLTKDEVRQRHCPNKACSTPCPRGMFIKNSSCVSNCGRGWYEAGTVCKPCWPGCSSCYGGRKDECVTCLPGRTLARGQCRLHCPRTMYSTATGCTNCHHFCSTCNGGGAYSCTTCSIDRYMDESSGLCYSCHESCSRCSGPSDTDCTSCRQNLFLDQGQCIKSVLSPFINHINNAQGGKTHSSSAGKRRIYYEWKQDQQQQHPMSWFEDDKESAARRPPSSSIEYSPYLTVTIIAVIASLAIVVLFALLLATLQVR